MSEKIAVIGLGYVGLPLAVALSKHFEVIGFDKNPKRVSQLIGGEDITREVEPDIIRGTKISFTSKPADLAQCTCYIVAVPTPIDSKKKPDLSIIVASSETIGPQLKAGDLVIFESTVYPGVTEEVCGPILARSSGLKLFSEIKLGYSPERINPGDKERTIEKIIKVVSGQDTETLDRVDTIYSKIISAGTHRAPSIKVAEASKVIENTQRDLNIALMNELAIMFEKFDINTQDVLEAAGTKWNFLKFVPGLVGGHCIGVDPYYLTSKAEEHGYNPSVILGGRRINDAMGEFVASKVIKMLIKNDVNPSTAKVGIYGITFKENVPDIRNSRVLDIIKTLKDYSIDVSVYDPYAIAEEVFSEYKIKLAENLPLSALDALIIAVNHSHLEQISGDIIESFKGILIDLKARYRNDRVIFKDYWSL